MESTLSLPRNKLAADVGLNLGYGRGEEFDETAWTDRQRADIEMCVDSGLSQFYFPPKTPDGEVHAWAFLKPVATLTLAEDESAVKLPDDFGGMEGQVTIAADESQSFVPINVVGIGVVYRKHSEAPVTTGRPLMVCQEPLKAMSTNQGQRWQLKVWPIADQDYSLRFQYYLLPNATDPSRPYYYGGMAHRETVLESCLSIAEQRLDDTVGVHTAKFLERLQASIALDKRHKEQNFGYCGDRSDNMGRHWRDPHGMGINTITFAGVEYP